MISAKRPSVYGKLQISNCCAEIKKIWYSRNHEPDDPAIVEILDFDYETNEHVLFYFMN